MVNKNNKSRAASVSLLAKLDVQKDERLTKVPIETGRIRHFFNVFKSNYTDLMLANLLFIVFALPAILVIFMVVPRMISALNINLDFNGDMGIAFGGRYEVTEGLLNIYNSWQWGFLMLVPCFALMGIGMAGLFYCVRNMLWGAPVKIRIHFFRGIKKRWAEFLLAFTYLGFVVWAVGYSIFEYLKSNLNGTANAGHWVFMIFSCLLALLSILYLMMSLPMYVNFRFKFGSNIKNSIILSLTMFVAEIILLIVLAIPFLMMLSDFTKMIFYVALAMIGISFYTLAISALAQNVFDSTIIPLYEHELKEKEKEAKKERDRQNRQTKANRKKRR